MGKSYRRTPITGNCGDSEKWDKKNWHSRFRAHVRDTIRKVMRSEDITEEDGTVFPHIRDVSNPWSMKKDGKHWLHDPDESFYRK